MHTVDMKSHRREFLALIAALMSCQALAVDAMLPALPTIAAALGVAAANHMQWVVTVYIAGLGFGQFFWGMVSDRYGRRPVLLCGLAAYVVAAAFAAFAGDFPALLAWRFVHGLAAASLVVSRSIVRDLFEGRQMARVMSLTFIVFLLVPIIAPSFGQLMLMFASWRALFVAFSLFGTLIGVWVLLRLPETLHPEYRYTLTPAHVAAAAWRVLSERLSLWYTLAQAVTFGSVLAYIGTVQQVFQSVFARPGLMPAMFAVCAVTMAIASYSNARLVLRFGMRRLSQLSLLALIVVSVLHIAIAAQGHETLAGFVVLQSLKLACVGFMGANFGAMGMERMGEIAGLAAAVQGALSTVGGALVGSLIGRYFDASTLPLAIGVLGCALAALLCVLGAERGRLFQTQHATAAGTTAH